MIRIPGNRFPTMFLWETETAGKPQRIETALKRFLFYAVTLPIGWCPWNVLEDPWSRSEDIESVCDTGGEHFETERSRLHDEKKKCRNQPPTAIVRWNGTLSVHSVPQELSIWCRFRQPPSFPWETMYRQRWKMNVLDQRRHLFWWDFKRTKQKFISNFHCFSNLYLP